MIKPIYEDNHILVVEKPFNIPVQEDSSKDVSFMTEIKEYLREKYDKKGNVYLGLVHRLDRPVGGLMVFARTSKAASRLSEQVRNGTFQKYYHAVVHGFPEEKGVFEDYLLKDRDENTSHVVEEGTEFARYAKLEYEVTERFPDRSEVKIHLITGRSHQIRVQFSSRGFPILGDMKYGGQEKGNIALFSTGLSFTHPVLKEKMDFRVEPKGPFFAKKMNK